MIILEHDSKVYTMKDIINFINSSNLNLNESTVIKVSHDLNLKIFGMSEIFFSFNFGKVIGINILRKPIIYYDLNGEKFEFISNEQLNKYLEKFYIPRIFCETENIKDIVNFANLNNHRNCKYFIKELFKIKIYNSVDFHNFFNLRPTQFIKNSFDIPTDFEKNFNYYFNIKGNINTYQSFYIYDDNIDSRSFFCLDFLNMNCNKRIFNYYGYSGIGKSITIIGALKFRDNFSKLGSLYINCKTIKNLLKQLRFLEVKQLLIDEVIFLNPYDYSSYRNLVEYILNFKFINEFSFWDLIINILNIYFFKNRKYIFVFDQYNVAKDPESKLNLIKKEYFLNRNMKCIILSSMNEKDIRKIKELNLFNENLISKNEEFSELKNICNIIDGDLSIEKRKVLEKMGNRLKNLIEIKNSKDLTKYLESQKLKYFLKIISFYLEGEQKEEFLRKKSISYIPSEIIGKILKFQIGYKYDKETLISIIDNIPFRFFDFNGFWKDFLKRKDKDLNSPLKSKKENIYYGIKFSFPLIEEVMTEIYKLILSSNSYNYIKSLLKNQGSGLETIFKLSVMNHLSPKIGGPKKKFNNFIITDKFKIHDIIQNDNKNTEKYTLKNNTCYIVEQDIFNGKEVDCLIIEMKGNIPYIYGLKISIYKDSNIEKNSLKQSLMHMINNLERIFSQKIDYDKVFFYYVFDYSKVGDDDYNEMIKDCSQSGFEYFFFDCEKNIFCDKYNNKINDIKSNTNILLDNIKNNNQSFNNSLFNYFINERITPTILNQIENSIASERKENSIKLKYLCEEIGPIIDKDKVNIQCLPLGIQFIFLNNQKLISKILDEETGGICDNDLFYNNTEYLIYEII